MFPEALELPPTGNRTLPIHSEMASTYPGQPHTVGRSVTQVSLFMVAKKQHSPFSPSKCLWTETVWGLGKEPVNYLHCSRRARRCGCLITENWEVVFNQSSIHIHNEDHKEQWKFLRNVTPGPSQRLVLVSTITSFLKSFSFNLITFPGFEVKHSNSRRINKFKTSYSELFKQRAIIQINQEHQ